MKKYLAELVGTFILALIGCMAFFPGQPRITCRYPSNVQPLFE